MTDQSEHGNAVAELSARAYKWHRKPYGYFHKRCPFCGLGSGRGGSHRAVKPGENINNVNVRYLFRDARGRRVPVMKPGANRTSPKGRKIRRAPTGPTKRILGLLTQAAGLAALGKTFEQIATVLGQNVHNVSDWRKTHSDLWTAAYDRAMENVFRVVQAQAGTSAVLDDPDQFISMADKAERWGHARGQSLFPTPERETLSTFFESFYLPNCLSDASPTTVALYRSTLRRWQLLAGDPALTEITSAMLVLFRDCLSRLRGQAVGTLMSPNSIRGSLLRLQTLLSKAGPPGWRNRDGQDLIARVPWCRPPRAVIREPRFVTSEQLEATYSAAVCMEWPIAPGVKAPAWWRALLVTAYNTGIRRGALFKLRMTDIQWDDCALVVRAATAKTGIGQRIPLNKTVLGHLSAIRTNRELVFPLSFGSRHFDTVFHRLQKAAGIPRDEHFGLHDLRRTAATLMWEESPAAAQLMLGHTTSRTTRQFYVNNRSILARAVARIPQPAAFSATELNGGAA